MASLPYITSPGNISKALHGIKSAAVPEVVSQDFVKTILKIPGGSGDQVTSFLKKLGFADSSGKPTDLYTKFRNPTSSGLAAAKAMKKAYAPLYVRHEYMHELNDAELLGLIVEETGQAHDANPVKLTFSAIKALKEFADFSAEEGNNPIVTELPETSSTSIRVEAPNRAELGNIGLNLGYTININLPASTDQAVFNAIFKSLKENLLRDDDA
jgi:hypothetical protein